MKWKNNSCSVPKPNHSRQVRRKLFWMRLLLRVEGPDRFSRLGQQVNGPGKNPTICAIMVYGPQPSQPAPQGQSKSCSPEPNSNGAKPNVSVAEV